MELGLNIRGQGDEGGGGLGWDGSFCTILKLAVISKDGFLGCQGQSPQPPHSHPLSPQKSHVAASEVLLQQAGSSWTQWVDPWAGVGPSVGLHPPLRPRANLSAHSAACPRQHRLVRRSPRPAAPSPLPAPPLRSSFRGPEAPGAKSRQSRGYFELGQEIACDR